MTQVRVLRRFFVGFPDVGGMVTFRKFGSDDSIAGRRTAVAISNDSSTSNSCRLYFAVSTGRNGSDSDIHGNLRRTKNKGCRARSDRSGAPRQRHRAVPLEAGNGNSGRGQQGDDAHLLHGPDEDRESPAGLSDNIDDVAPGSGCVVSQPCFVRILGLPSSASWGPPRNCGELAE